jgi:hypothetical protein
MLCSQQAQQLAQQAQHVAALGAQVADLRRDKQVGAGANCHARSEGRHFPYILPEEAFPL